MRGAITKTGICKLLVETRRVIAIVVQFVTSMDKKEDRGSEYLGISQGFEVWCRPPSPSGSVDIFAWLANRCSRFGLSG